MNIIERYTTYSEAETEALGATVAQTLTAGDVLLFHGGLGMGKTAFVRGLAAGLGYRGDVSSPTFTILNEYRGGRLNLCHVDAYRLSSGGELFEIGFYDYLDSGWVAAIEWGEQVEDTVTPTLLLEFARIDDDTRAITLTRGES